MKSIGVVRKVDELGRIVLPVEIRRTLSIKAGKDKENNTPLEIFIDGEQIILRKYEPCCIFCAESKGLSEYKRKKICPSCIKVIGGNSIWKGDLI